MRKTIIAIVAAAIMLSLGGGLVSAAQTSTATSVATPDEATSTDFENQTIDQRLTFIEKGVQELLQRVPDSEKLPPEMPPAFGGPGHRERRGTGDQIDLFKKKFGLTDDQVNQLKAIFEENQEPVKGLQESIKSAQEELKLALKSNPTDMNAVQQATEELASLEKDLLENMVQQILKIKEVVGPDIFQEIGRFWGPFRLMP